MEPTPKHNTKPRNWLGVRLHHLTIIQKLPSRRFRTYTTTLWLALCDCGRTREVQGKQMKKDKLRTCGHRKCPYRKPSAIKNRNVWIKPKVKWNLSIQEQQALSLQPCHFCGAEGPNGVTLVNTELPYTLSNVVPCCVRCAKWKDKLGIDDFLDTLKYILTFSLKKAGLL